MGNSVKVILYMSLILMIITVIFSGCTEVSDSDELRTVEIITNGATIRNANGLIFTNPMMLRSHELQTI